MAALSRRAEKLARDWGPREARARAQREAEVEGGRRMTERLEAAVEAEMLRELEARRAEAAMTPEQRNEARLQSLEHPPQAPQPSTNAGRRGGESARGVGARARGAGDPPGQGHGGAPAVARAPAAGPAAIHERGAA